MGTCDTRRVEAILRERAAAFHQRNPVPGLSIAVIVPGVGSAPVTATLGDADPDSRRALRPDDRMLAGSVGKTFFAAAALKLAEQGQLDLDGPIRSYLQGRRLPNDEAVTPRMLLAHRSGYPTYDAEFMHALIEAPLQVRGFDDWAGPIRRSKDLGVPGDRYAYSDVNYVVLSQVIEGAAGESADAYIQRNLLDPLGLRDTVPATSPVIVGLVPGFEGNKALFGADRVLDASGLRFNPQFESGGGGFASTSSDLARWVAALHAGRATSASAWRLMSTPTGQWKEGRLYGYGIHIDRTSLGIAYGHSGYIPGYLSWVRVYPQTGITVAVQTNTSDEARIVEDGYTLVDGLGEALAGACMPREHERVRAAARAIQASIDRSAVAVRNKDLDVYFAELPEGFEILEDDGSTTSREVQRAKVAKQWELVTTTHVFDAYVERLQLEGERATVWTSQLWERDMLGKDGRSTFRVVTTNPHREEWVETPAGWRLRAVEELGGATLVNGKRY
jgi:D-alanyl-D-alanine carboxypeptidase